MAWKSHWQSKQANLLNKLKAEEDAEERERAKVASKCRARNVESWRRAQKAHKLTLLRHQKEQEVRSSTTPCIHTLLTNRSSSWKEKLKLSRERQNAASKKYRRKVIFNIVFFSTNFYFSE